MQSWLTDFCAVSLTMSFIHERNLELNCVRNNTTQKSNIPPAVNLFHYKSNFLPTTAKIFFHQPHSFLREHNVCLANRITAHLSLGSEVTDAKSCVVKMGTVDRSEKTCQSYSRCLTFSGFIQHNCIQALCCEIMKLEAGDFFEDLILVCAHFPQKTNCAKLLQQYKVYR